MRTQEEVRHAFSPVGKLDPAQTARVQKLTVAFNELATEMLDLIPESSDRTSAMRMLLESKFMAVQAVTHDRSWAKK